MKTHRQNTKQWILMWAATLMATVAFAQGNPPHSHKGKGKDGVSSHHHVDSRWDYRHAPDRHDLKYGRIDHNRYQRHQRAPRYVYYRDYNVYYDRERHVYICPSNKGWIATSWIPARMRGVNLHHTPTFAVEYFGNGLGDYLAHHRPNYIQIQVIW